MATQNNSRASDLGAILTAGSTDFTPRKRSGVGVFFHLFMLASMIILGTALLIYYESPKGCALAIAIGLALGIIAQNLEKLKKQKNALEFMNALFSSALGRGYKFCFIVKNTGDIVFYNRPFQDFFPAYITQDTRTLESLFTLYGIAQVDRETIHGYMVANTDGSVTISPRTAEGPEIPPVALSIEPIGRPTGFFLVRGK
jgi:hypothetical protein